MLPPEGPMPMNHLRLFGGAQLSICEDSSARRLTLPPKPMALLAYLAVASADGVPVRRDVLVALFWPELSTRHARGALRQLLFQLRRSVGEIVLRGDRESVAIVPEAVTCDVVRFEHCLAGGDRAAAVGLYRGPLLDGFFVDGASVAYEEWVAAARARFRAKAFAACASLADEAERNSNGIAAAQWARAAVALAPDDEIAVRRLIQTLDAFGDTAGALRVADDFARRLSSEFDAAPSVETQALISTIRARRPEPGSEIVNATSPAPMSEFAPATGIGAPDAPGVERIERAEPPMSRADAPRRRQTNIRRRVFGVTLAATVVAVALVATRRGGATPGPDVPTHGLTPPITIRSERARGLYDLGLARYQSGDAPEASRLLIAALASDSDCAMCAYYAAMANMDADDAAAEQMLDRANRLAGRVSEPERLLIHYRWADATNSFARRAIADSLVTRYPRWPEAQAAAAEAAGIDGDWLVAEDHLRRAIAGEPLPSSTSNGACPPCATRIDLIDAYQAGDSLAAALRAAQAFVREQPHSRLPWFTLSHALAASGRYDEARAAMDSSTRYATGADDAAAHHAEIEIRARNFSTADRLLTTIAQTGDAGSRSDALWGLVISLRTQGRLHEALDLARGEFRRVNGVSPQGLGLSGAAEGQIEFELGHYARAASIFERLSTVGDSFSQAAVGRMARQHAWMMTQAGSAIAAEGDTVTLAALVDTVHEWGLKSGFGRDRRLHEYLRGLLWTARERPDSAAAAFSRATLSESDGYSRLNLARAQALVALGRPREGIVVLQHSLAGPIQGGNFYATQTDIEESLARAYEAAGELDSAAVYYRYVVSAWRDADAQFQPRVARARERLAADERRLIAQHRSPAHASSP